MKRVSYYNLLPVMMLGLALVSSRVSFGRPVGEWEEPVETSAPGSFTEEVSEEKAFVGLSNLSQLETTLEQARVFGLPVLAPAAKPAQKEPKPEEIVFDSETEKTEAAGPISVGSGATGEISPQASLAGAVSGTGSSYDLSMPSFLPFDTRRLESSVAGMNQVPGVSIANPLVNSYRPLPGSSGDRSPAVLAANDPSLKGLFTPPPQAQAVNGPGTDWMKLKKQSDQATANTSEPFKFKKGDKKDEADEDQAKREAIQKVVKELLGRPTPYSEKDYQDFRDFVAKQRKDLGDMDDFREKAQQAYDLWAGDDKDPFKARAKEEFEGFLNEMEEPAQDLMERRLPAPGARDTHGGGFTFGGRPQAN